MKTADRPASAGISSDSHASQLIARTLRGDLAWVDGEPWDEGAIADDAVSHGLDLVLWHELRARRVPADGLIGRLATNVAPEVVRSAVRDRELARVLERFAADRVDCVVLKGAALAHTCYPKPWLRPRLDTDMLVEREAFDRAARVLEDAGYSRSTTFSTGDFVSHQVAFERTDRHGVDHTIDLHWRALNPQVLAGIFGFDVLRDDGMTVELHGIDLRVPGPLWSLALACAHRLAHHQQQERLLWLYDIHLLAGRLVEGDWRRLIRIARERQISAICADGLGRAAGLFATAVPATVLKTLNDAGRSDPSRRYVERDVRRLEVLRDDLRRLRRWRDRLHLLKEHAFPPAAFMSNRYGSRSRLFLPLLYAHRLVTGAVRWIRT